MDFLKRHYEKVILVGLFLIFIGLMVMVQGIIERTQNISDAQLQIPRPKDDYDADAVKAENKAFDPAYMWNNTKLIWDAAASRDAKSVRLGPELIGFSDLVSVFPIAACPYCKSDGESKTLIPLDNFSTKEVARKCPKCGHDLPMPQERRKVFVGIKTEQDLDGDGIPNDAEQKYGLNPNDPDDALYDMDNDGFSNLFEIENGTNPRDPASHPPYWWRLRLKDVKQIELPIRFMALNDNNSSDKKEWELQFNSPHPRIKGRVVSTFCRIGEIVEIENREYRVEDVIRSSKTVKLEKGVRGSNDATRLVDTSKALLTEIISDEASRAPDKLSMTIAQPAYSSDKRPVLEDVGFPGGREYALRIGDVVYVGNTTAANLRRDRRAGRYQLKSVDVEKMVVQLADLSVRGSDDTPPPLVDVTAEGRIPAASRVMERRDSGDGAMEPEPMPRPGLRSQPRKY